MEEYRIRKCMTQLLESLVYSVHICQLRTSVGSTCLSPTNLMVGKRSAAVLRYNHSTEVKIERVGYSNKPDFHSLPGPLSVR
jgi:hypothetical protein